MKEEKAKQIISAFLKTEPSEITEHTIIDQRAIKFSVIWRRMFAALAKEGFNVSNPTNIKTFGELLNIHKENFSGKINDSNLSQPTVDEENLTGYNKSFLLGIDMEEVKNMPYSDDFREDAFYTQNYSSNEISYCILQKNPLIHFTGKFAAKEAVIKADNSYQNIPLNQIEILNDEKGKPYFKDFIISISHTENHAVAIVIKYVESRAKYENDLSSNIHIPENRQLQFPLNDKKKSNRIAYLALFISLVSLVITLLSNF